MTKKRTGDPWMPADAYGQSLRGMTINLLVENVEKALQFQTLVLGCEVVYSDPDFAVMRGYGAEWMLHADHTYDGHPLSARAVSSHTGRGLGVELRLHGCDPDKATAAAAKNGYTVLAAATDKPHGLRETFIVDDDGYVWVPDIPRVAPGS